MKKHFINNAEEMKGREPSKRTMESRPKMKRFDLLRK